MVRIIAIAGLAALVVPGRPQSGPVVRDLVQAYFDADRDAALRRFARGADVEAALPAVRAWLDGQGTRVWPVATTVVLLDLASIAARSPEPAPEAAQQLIRWSYENITSKEAERDPLQSLELARRVHEAAVAILQALERPEAIRRYINRVERKYDQLSPRLWLARGLAIERERVPAAADGSGLDDDTIDDLEDAIRAYDRAARDPVVRAEASARAAAAYLRMGRHRDAWRRLETAGETSDVPVAAWLAGLRSRTFDEMGDSAAASISAELARQLSPAADPAAVLRDGDHRFVSEWLATLASTLDRAVREKARAAGAGGFLNRYAAGDYDMVAAALGKLASLEQFSKALREGASAWIAERGPLHANRRQLIVAVVALEAARARGAAEWPHAQLLLEWACGSLRSRAQPDEAGRLWMWAASTLMAGVVASAAMDVHVTHALERFPRDPALTMASAIAAELRAGPDIRGWTGTRPRLTQATQLDIDLGRDPAFHLVQTRLRAATQVEGYRAEASVRLGYTALRQGDAEDALKLLTEALDPRHRADSFVAYLAHLFRGRAFDRLKRWPEAVTAYRAALALQPGAQSAMVALAAALARAGDRSGAADAAQTALTAIDPAPDPWLAYGQGDLRRWPGILQQLRRAIQ